jgi:hypothetical protein
LPLGVRVTATGQRTAFEDSVCCDAVIVGPAFFFARRQFRICTTLSVGRLARCIRAIFRFSARLGSQKVNTQMRRRRLSIRDVRVLADDAEQEQLLCPICVDVVHEARACRDGHLFCQACIVEWLGNPRHGCPVDRRALRVEELVKPPLVEELTSRLKVACSNEQLVEDVQQGCAWTGPFGELEGHLKVCPFRPLACRWCEEVAAVGVTVAHELQCGRRPLSCVHCAKDVRAAEMAAHVSGPCRVAPTGDVECFCGERIKRAKQEEHLQQGGPRHVLAQQRQLAEQSEQIAAQQQRLAAQEERVRKLEESVRANQDEATRQSARVQVTLSMVPTMCFVWRLVLTPDPNVWAESAEFLFAGLPLSFCCRWRSGIVCEVALRPVAVAGPPFVLAKLSVGDGRCPPAAYALCSDGKTWNGQ